MTEVLGYRQFVVAGGDGGSAIAQSMAIQFPGSVIGVHLTDIGWQRCRRSDAHRHRAANTSRRPGGNFMEDGAYAAVQAVAATRAGREPQRFARGPRFLDRRSLSFLVRFAATSRASFSKDEMLTNITIYWVTQTIQSSIYGYLAETRQPSLAHGRSRRSSRRRSRCSRATCRGSPAAPPRRALTERGALDARCPVAATSARGSGPRNSPPT